MSQSRIRIYNAARISLPDGEHLSIEEDENGYCLIKVSNPTKVMIEVDCGDIKRFVTVGNLAAGWRIALHDQR